MHWSEIDHGRWFDLDQTADPEAFVRYLDSSRAPMMAYLNEQPGEAFAHLRLEPGMHVLDVGCGTGALLHPLAALLAPEGKVTGVDRSQTMVDAAIERAADLPLTFHRMDADALAFPDATFDRATAHNTFQHLPDPERALAEMVRVTKPGGLVSVVDQDWETYVVDAADRDLTRRILNSFTDAATNGWMGRRLAGLFHRAGLTELQITPITFVLTPPMFPIFLSSVQSHLRRLLLAQRITTEEVTAWLTDLNAKAVAGEFFAASTSFRAIGEVGPRP